MRKSVLILEDNFELGSLMKSILSKVDFHTVLYENRTDGLQELRLQAYSIVFLDYDMPGVSFEHFVAMSRILHPKMHIILLTGDLDAHEIAARAGISFVLRKPFDARLLIHYADRAMLKGADSTAALLSI